MLHRERVRLCVGGLNVGIHRTQRDWRKDCRPSSRKRAEIVRRERVRAARKGNDRVCGGILDNVEGDITEVALVANAITAADRRLSVPEQIIGKADTGTKIPR